MKQTVEEAMSYCAKERGIVNETDGMYCRGYSHGFKDGSAWQREQGIEWINASFPPQQESGISKEVLFYKGCYGIHYGYYNFKENIWFSYTLNSIVRIPATHWAYINTPKTDK